MCPRSGATKLLLWFIAAFLICGSLSLHAANIVEKRNTLTNISKRPSVGEIRSETRDILKNPKFAPRKSFNQWLFEKFQDGEIKLPSKLPVVLRVAGWIIIIGCAIGILLLLAYVIYSIVIAIKTRSSKSSFSELYAGEFMDVTKLSYEELRAKMEACAQKGDYKNAIRYMMLTLLRWLDANRILTFHESKTNGDYLREYAIVRTGAEHFRQFVKRFDYSIYGGIFLNSTSYDGMNELYDEVCKDASAKK